MYLNEEFDITKSIVNKKCYVYNKSKLNVHKKLIGSL